MFVMWGCEDVFVLVELVFVFDEKIFNFKFVIYDEIGYILMEEYVVMSVDEVWVFIQFNLGE